MCELLRLGNSYIYLAPFSIWHLFLKSVKILLVKEVWTYTMAYIIQSKFCFPEGNPYQTDRAPIYTNVTVTSHSDSHITWCSQSASSQRMGDYMRKLFVSMSEAPWGFPEITGQGFQSGTICPDRWEGKRQKDIDYFTWHDLHPQIEGAWVNTAASPDMPTDWDAKKQHCPTLHGQQLENLLRFFDRKLPVWIGPNPINALPLHIYWLWRKYNHHELCILIR